MAELVFQNLEEMLPELEELERQDVFKREELRIIIKRRTDFEYKLQKRIVEKQDILDYIEYELKLDLLRKKRSKRLKLKPYSTATLTANRRMHTLFKKALMKFGNDLKLWIQYIDFCKKLGNVKAVGTAFGKLIQNHAHNPDVWLMAAKYDFEETNNIENARTLLQRALRSNKESHKLWHEYFRLELLHVEKIIKRRQVLGVGAIDLKENDEDQPQMMEEFLGNKTAQIVYKNAIKNINDDLEFRIGFLQVCENFQDIDDVEDLIYESLLADFPDSAITHDFSSKRPLLKLYESIDNIVKDEEWKTVEEEVEQRYREAITKINTDMMWEKYLNTFVDLLKRSSSPEQASRRMNIILNILKDAEKQKQVSEVMYTFYVELLLDMDEKAECIQRLTNALKAHKQSAHLWQKYLILKAEDTDNWSTLKKEFKKCLPYMKQDKLSIWQMYIDMASASSSDDIEIVFEESMTSSQDVKDFILPQYLDWMYKEKGIKATRQFYRRMLKETLQMNFLQKCIQLEEIQDKRKLSCLRTLYEKLVDSYGETRPDVWLSYIQFEQNVVGDDLERVGLLYNKAKATLKGKLNSEFIKDYTLFQNNN